MSPASYVSILGAPDWDNGIESHFTNGVSFVFQIALKIGFVVIQFPLTKSLQITAQTSTAQLSLYVHNFAAITL